MIKPTVGRVVWYYKRGKPQLDAKEQPFSAQVAYVHDDRCINIGYFDHNGVAENASSVPLLQDEDVAPTSGFCMWMPYQKGQATKTEQAEAALARGAP